MTRTFVTLTEIKAARAVIAPHILRTPAVPSASLTERMGLPVHLKLEHRQITGAFKLRGALNALNSLSPDERQRGVVTASTGNHGRALAYASGLQSIRSVICMSNLVPGNKVDEIRKLGAEIRIVGTSQDEAQEEVEKIVARDGLVMVPPFDDPAIVAGQGTIGLEIVEDVPDVETVLVPLSGGGLIAGIAAAIKGLKPKTRIIGISMQNGAAMAASLKAGHPVSVVERQSLADSLGGGIGLSNNVTFGMVRALVDEVVLLSEEEIAAGIVHAYAQEREIIEGAAAVGIGALLAGKIRLQGTVIALLSGRNIDMDQHRRIVAGYQAGETMPCPA
ncbi:hydroxyectoine utilization dehydratase EutB [Phyllobacterium calauticae]|uniref:hydroxyectoine utilization dehydratase EutB n=1 Tax=Phyllobacterium calauticae TaxID=2817027 RepID=UPI001CBDC21E|nr:hydroxyectoine utilization dehydratase EutB [Phyllobacterium calauticae]MBZ3695207.1 hydroxyectoine utilization dehydratase EutB [Phyllobacterium calauticae]